MLEAMISGYHCYGGSASYSIAEVQGHVKMFFFIRVSCSNSLRQLQHSMEFYFGLLVNFKFRTNVSKIVV